MSDDDEEDGGFTHRKVSAASAPPVQTAGVNSIFAAGQASDAAFTPPPQEQGEKSLSVGTLKERALKCIESCGRLNAAQFSEALGLTKERGARLAVQLCASGLLRRVEGTKPLQYERAINDSSTPASRGFKNWLEKKAQPSAEGRAVRKAKAAPRPLPMPVLPPAAPVTEMPTPSLCCGLLSTGELLIEVADTRLRLTRLQARELVGYLDLVSEALKAA